MIVHEHAGVSPTYTRDPLGVAYKRRDAPLSILVRAPYLDKSDEKQDEVTTKAVDGVKGKQISDDLYARVAKQTSLGVCRGTYPDGGHSHTGVEGIARGKPRPRCSSPAPCWSTNTIMATTVHLRFSAGTSLKAYSTSTRREWLTSEAIRIHRCHGIQAFEFDRLLNLLSLEFASTVGPPRWMRTFSAPSYRPLCTSHYGDSGANGRPINRMAGKVHWRALREQIRRGNVCIQYITHNESL